MAPVDEALAEVAKLEKELSRRRPEIDEAVEYVDGKQPLVFASEQYCDWFGDQYKGFADNFCLPVVEAMTERMHLMGVRPRKATKVDATLRQWWEESGAAADAPLAFNTMATARRVFALVWDDGSGDGVPEVTFEDPRQAIVAYEPGSRRKRRSALKMWRDDEYDYATLYTPKLVWKFQRARFGQSTNLELPPAIRADLGAWQERRGLDDEAWPIENPLGVVPMVELQNRPKLIGEPLSEIAGVISMQDAINAFWAYLFTAGDFAALPQRVILGAQLPKIPVLNKDGQKIGEKPIDLPEANIKRILNLEGPNAKIGQWDSANLEIFTGVIEKAVGHISNQTRTPLYYFATAIQNISGDTLKALDSGLVAKIGERLTTTEDPVLEIHRLMALVADNKALADSIRGGTAVWRDWEVRSEAQKVDALAKLKDIGFPFEYIAERYVNGDADELDRIMVMYKAQVREDPLMLLAQRNADLDRQAKQQQGDGEDAPAEGDGGAEE